VKKQAGKVAPKKASARKTAAKKVVKKAAKTTTQRVVAGKPAAKPATKKKAAPKKTARKAVKKAVAKKPATKKTARKTVKKIAKKTVKKSVAKKPAVKKAVKKTVKKKVAAKKPAARKTPEKKASPSSVQLAYGIYDGTLLCDNPKAFPSKSPYSKKELALIHHLLKEERDRLMEALRDLDELTFHTATDNNGGASPGYSIHLAEDASDNIEKETALLVRRSEEAKLIQVNAALERMESPIFGVCMACGSKIGMPRLKAMPEAHLCITCRKKYDKESSAR